jgi:hypothetical protein
LNKVNNENHYKTKIHIMNIICVSLKPSDLSIDLKKKRIFNHESLYLSLHFSSFTSKHRSQQNICFTYPISLQTYLYYTYLSPLSDLGTCFACQPPFPLEWVSQYLFSLGKGGVLWNHHVCIVPMSFSEGIVNYLL